MTVSFFALMIKFARNKFPRLELTMRRPRRRRQCTLTDRAQLRLFGKARPLVELLAERIRVRAVTENAYTDITYAVLDGDRDDTPAPSTTLFMVMVAEEWDNVNKELRKGRTPLELLTEHIAYVSSAQVIDHFRNLLHAAIGSYSVHTSAKCGQVYGYGFH